nr:hypothetical protein Itr_chr07CG09790 [Ipomoea trifida]
MSLTGLVAAAHHRWRRNDRRRRPVEPTAPAGVPSRRKGTIQGFFATQARCCCRGVLSVTIQRSFAAAMPETGNAKLPPGLA